MSTSLSLGLRSLQDYISTCVELSSCCPSRTLIERTYASTCVDVQTRRLAATMMEKNSCSDLRRIFEILTNRLSLQNNFNKLIMFSVSLKCSDRGCARGYDPVALLKVFTVTV